MKSIKNISWKSDLIFSLSLFSKRNRLALIGTNCQFFVIILTKIHNSLYTTSLDRYLVIIMVIVENAVMCKYIVSRGSRIWQQLNHAKPKFWYWLLIKLDFHIVCHLEYSNYNLHLYCYIRNVSADASFGLLHMFPVKLGRLHRTSKRSLPSILGVDWSNSLNYNRVRVFSYCKFFLSGLNL